MKDFILKRTSVIVVLVISFYACNEPSAPENTSVNNQLEKIIGGYGISLGNVDASPISGLLAAYVHSTTDSDLPEADTKYGEAFMRDANNAPQLLNTITLNLTNLNAIQPPDQNKTYMGAGNTLYPLGTTNWNVLMANGETFTGSLVMPSKPEFTNIQPYQTINTADGFNIQVNAGVPGGEIGVIIMHDGLRNNAFGDTSSVTGHEGFKIKYFSSDDDGNIEIPASLVSQCYNSRVYTLQLVRFNYLTQERGDNKKIGKLGIVSNSIPVKFQK